MEPEKRSRVVCGRAGIDWKIALGYFLVVEMFCETSEAVTEASLANYHPTVHST
jgi:hypothetical protein